MSSNEDTLDMAVSAGLVFSLVSGPGMENTRQRGGAMEKSSLFYLL